MVRKGGENVREYMTTREVAQFFGFSQDATVCIKARKGLLPGYKVPGCKQWRFNRADIEKIAGRKWDEESSEARR